jgi:hypothetical protein
MANYSSAIISLFFWIIVISLLLSCLYQIAKYLCPNILNFEVDPEPEDIVFEPEPVADVQMIDNIAGQEVIINGFV